MKFSICIPNYNYAQYIGRTIQSVLAQDYANFEIIVSDNCSTDDSWQVVNQIVDPRIRAFRNRHNVGFSANLDRAARRASGDFLIMLSSDDIMHQGALTAYRHMLEKLGQNARRCVISSSVEVIDSSDCHLDCYGVSRSIWMQQDLDSQFGAAVNGAVYSLRGRELLRRCISQMKNPLPFAATCYSRDLYEEVEGYGGGRLINPDRWFNWKLFAVADQVFFVDRPFFGYRIHSNNQTAQQIGTQSIKYQIDEYVATLELDSKLLSELGLTREQVVDSFVEYDIARNGLSTLGGGARQRARQILDFGRAVYPAVVSRNRKIWALRMLIALGPIGTAVARSLYRRYSMKSQEAAAGH
jgi:glycosyltransferase involved in cell wall biosynthesis